MRVMHDDLVNTVRDVSVAFERLYSALTSDIIPASVLRDLEVEAELRELHAGISWLRAATQEETLSIGQPVMDMTEDDSRPAAELTVDLSAQGCFIGVSGHGEKTSEQSAARPVMLELYRGEVRVIAWGDINQEDPTDFISLDGAREDRREEAAS